MLAQPLQLGARRRRPPIGVGDDRVEGLARRLAVQQVEELLAHRPRPQASRRSNSSRLAAIAARGEHAEDHHGAEHRERAAERPTVGLRDLADDPRARVERQEPGHAPRAARSAGTSANTTETTFSTASGHRNSSTSAAVWLRTSAVNAAASQVNSSV